MRAAAIAWMAGVAIGALLGLHAPAMAAAEPLVVVRISQKAPKPLGPPAPSTHPAAAHYRAQRLAAKRRSRELGHGT